MTARLAILGAGSIGTKHAEAAQAAGARIAYVVDSDLNRARMLGQRFDAPHTDSCNVAFDDAAVDGVIVSVPNFLHKDLALAALHAGKDVLLEKPMALSAGECDELVSAAESNDRILQVAYVHRYSAVARMAKSLIGAGRLGPIYHSQAHIYFRRGIPGLGRWFTTKSLSGGGALIDVGVHLIDLALYMLDFPAVADVYGQVYSHFGRRMRGYDYESMWAGPPDLNGRCDVEDSAHALVRFADGGTLDLHVAWAGNFPQVSVPPTMMKFFGECGGMTFELFGDHIDYATEENGCLVDRRLDVKESDFFLDQMTDFIRSIDTRIVCGATAEQGVAVQSIVDAVYQSSAALPGMTPT